MKQHPNQLRRIFCGAAFWGGCVIVSAQEPVSVRVENFVVTPSTGPVVNVQLRNQTAQPAKATVQVRWPEGWKASPKEQLVDLASQGTAKAAFTLEQAVDLAANSYSVEVEARVGDRSVVRKQQVVCATAPYLKPKIDGQLEDWKDAVPLSFSTRGKTTTVMSCWNRQLVCIAVRVQQDQFSPLDPATGKGSDAVQFALASESGGQSLVAGEKSGRYEFLVTATGNGVAKGFLLLQPGDDLKLAEQDRALEPLECHDLQAVVRHDGGFTCYEIAVPVKLVAELRPSPGRAFCFSLLVHDGDAAGPRDLGSLMNFAGDQRHPRSWCRWKGAAFGPVLPFDNNAEFGFSSSIH